jgi:hypothetical protein
MHDAFASRAEERMSDINPVEPPRDTRRMLVIVSIALAVIVVALIIFVTKRGGAEGRLPGTTPANQEPPGAPSGGSAPAGSTPGSKPEGGR